MNYVMNDESQSSIKDIGKERSKWKYHPIKNYLQFKASIISKFQRPFIVILPPEIQIQEKIDKKEFEVDPIPFPINDSPKKQNSAFEAFEGLTNMENQKKSIKRIILPFPKEERTSRRASKTKDSKELGETREISPLANTSVLIGSDKFSQKGAREYNVTNPIMGEEFSNKSRKGNRMIESTPMEKRIWGDESPFVLVKKREVVIAIMEEDPSRKQRNKGLFQKIDKKETNKKVRNRVAKFEDNIESSRKPKNRLKLSLKQETKQGTPTNERKWPTVMKNWKEHLDDKEKPTDSLQKNRLEFTVVNRGGKTETQGSSFIGSTAKKLPQKASRSVENTCTRSYEFSHFNAHQKIVNFTEKFKVSNSPSSLDKSSFLDICKKVKVEMRKEIMNQNIERTFGQIRQNQLNAGKISSQASKVVKSRSKTLETASKTQDKKDYFSLAQENLNVRKLPIITDVSRMTSNNTQQVQKPNQQEKILKERTRVFSDPNDPLLEWDRTIHQKKNLVMEGRSMTEYYYRLYMKEVQKIDLNDLELRETLKADKIIKDRMEADAQLIHRRQKNIHHKYKFTILKSKMKTSSFEQKIKEMEYLKKLEANGYEGGFE